MKPVILSSKLTFAARVGDVQGPEDFTALQSPDHKAMLVDEIQAFWTPPDYQNSVPEISLSLGRAKMTNGFLPFWLVARIDNPYTVTGYSCANRASMTWRLPRPLFVPAGRGLTMFCRSVNANANTVHFAVRARIPGPTFVEPLAVSVPYITAFYPEGTSMAVVSTTIHRSVTGDLTNPFDVPFHIRSLLGFADGRLDHYLGATLAMSIGRHYAKPQLYDWNGNALIKNPTPLTHPLASSGYSEWAERFTLPARKSLYAVLDESHANIGREGSPRPGVSLSGWRNVPISEVK
jgi:hypothetical protein